MEYNGHVMGCAACYELGVLTKTVDVTPHPELGKQEGGLQGRPKHCYVCGEIKPKSEFRVANRKAGKMCSRCKKCDNKQKRNMTPNRIIMKRRIAKRYNENNPDKTHARQMAKYAYGPRKKGYCEICKKYKPLEKHHPDYTKPLEVMFLCRRCHMTEVKP
jgi:hypothetical protein